MATTTKKQNNLTRLYTALNAIEDYKDLRRNKLTLSEYYAAQEVYNELLRFRIAKTFISAVADFFKRFNFSVTLDYDKVNFIINL